MGVLKRRAAMLVAVAVTALTTACGADDSADPGPTGDGSGQSPTGEATPTPTDETTRPPSDEGTSTPTGEDTQTPIDEGTGPDAGGDDTGGGTAEPGLGDLPPFDPDTGRNDERGQSQGAQLTVTELRMGEHEDFDRVVLELQGQGTPGWSVQYSDNPTQQGSGAPVDLEGEETLTVVLWGMAYPTGTAATPYEGPNPLPGPDTDEVTEVLLGGPFEGLVEAFVGVEERQPFRVMLLEDPVRVVVDVQDD